MIVEGWITINSRKSIRLTKSKPGLNWDEVSIKIKIDLPDALFDRPRLSASIKIPEDAAMQEEVDAKVIENVKEALEQIEDVHLLKVEVIKDEQ